MGLAVPRLSFLALEAIDLALSDLFQTTCLSCLCLSPRALCDSCYRFSWLPEQSESLVQSALGFGEPWRTVLHRVKYFKHRELLCLLRPAIAAIDFGFVGPGAWVVPVPIHASTLCRRGFNQSEILAKWVAQHTALTFAPDSLRKTRPTANQSTLGRQERARNLSACFRWVGKVPRRVLLIDDVYTTGATFEMCRKELLRAGVQEVSMWTVFRTLAH
jgi:ComF family protein